MSTTQEAPKEHQRKNGAYFSIHLVEAMEKRSFSIVRANIENTPEKYELAKKLYPIKSYHFQYHITKIDLSPVIS